MLIFYTFWWWPWSWRNLTQFPMILSIRFESWVLSNRYHLVPFSHSWVTMGPMPLHVHLYIPKRSLTSTDSVWWVWMLLCNNCNTKRNNGESDDNLIQFRVSMLFFDKLIRNVKIESSWRIKEKAKRISSRQETKEDMSKRITLSHKFSNLSNM